MSLKKIIGLFIVIFILEGCASEQNAYLHAKYLPPTKVPQGLRTINPAQTYYPIPPVSMGPMIHPQQFSLLPPGSQSAQSQAAKIAAAQASAPPHVSPVVASSSTSLALNMTYDASWAQVGRALRAAGIRVMQQDKSMGAYYILDLAATGGHISTTTPIYRVNLKTVGNNTTITLLDANNNSVSPGVSSRIFGRLKQTL